jgi:hypothetical protein
MRGWRTSRSSTTEFEGVVAEVAKILDSCGVWQVHGDRCGGQWVREVFRRAGRVELDHATMVRQPRRARLLRDRLGQAL